MIIKKGDLEIRYEIIVKPIKHAYFHFKDDHILVTKHKRISNEHIESYLLTHFDKFYQRLNQQKKIPTYFGLDLKIHTVLSDRFHYTISDDITIYHKETMSLDKAIDTFYKKELENKLKALEPWLMDALKPIGLSPLPTKIKKLKTKYGSCHTRKHEITLNLFLAKLDVIYLKYVLLHEYAHIIVPNHQKPFYQVLDKLMPGHKDIQKALKKHHL